MDFNTCDLATHLKLFVKELGGISFRHDINVTCEHTSGDTVFAQVIENPHCVGKSCTSDDLKAHKMLSLKKLNWHIKQNNTGADNCIEASDPFTEKDPTVDSAGSVPKEATEKPAADYEESLLPQKESTVDTEIPDIEVGSMYMYSASSST